MLNYSWSEGYSVGDPILDGHHKSLLNMFNEISALLTKDKATDELLELVTKLKEYTEHHFSAEEVRMEASNYPDLASHREKHKVFVNQIESSYNRISDNPDEVTEDLFIFLSQWLITHIQKDDQNYKGKI